MFVVVVVVVFVYLWQVEQSVEVTFALSNARDISRAGTLCSVDLYDEPGTNAAAHVSLRISPSADDRHFSGGAYRVLLVAGSPATSDWRLGWLSRPVRIQQSSTNHTCGFQSIRRILLWNNVWCWQHGQSHSCVQVQERWSFRYHLSSSMIIASSLSYICFVLFM